ncbi:MAG: hypothetical protein HGB36_10620 [Chlorobiaceae bacterium]|nr:hypothetical protein [Chlorobiaceae bacterium]
MPLPNMEGGPSVPFWAQPIEVLHGVYIHEALLMIYLLHSFLNGSLYRMAVPRGALRYGLLIALLGVLGVISVFFNQYSAAYPIFDVFKALRLVLLSMFFLSMVHLARILGANVVLRIFLIGATIGGLINLYFTFRLQTKMIGILPMLFGQNGPGGALGVCIGLGALLMLIRRTRADEFVALSVLIIGCICELISFSKLGQLMALAGLIGWAGLFLSMRRQTQKHLIGFLFAGASLAALFYMQQPDLVTQIIESSTFLISKLTGEKVVDPEMDTHRLAYYYAVFDIMAGRPWVGVSYSGFADAINTLTVTIPDLEHEMNPSFANPHNAFLYYMAANGLPALPVIAALFGIFVFILWKFLTPFGISGVIIWACISVSYLLHGNSLPTLFNTEVMYIPAAIAFSRLKLDTPLFLP